MRRFALVLLATAAFAAAASRAEDDDKKPGPAKEVKVTTEDGLVLAADLYEPLKGGEGKPAVVLLHAEGGDRTMWKDTAAGFQEKGWSALALDVRGHGGSKIQKGTDPSASDAQGGTDLSVKVAARDPETFAAMWRDAAAGVKYLRATLLADGAKISIAGCGACGAAGLDAASRDAKVAAVLWIGPAVNNFGAGGQEAIRKWDGRPLGLMTTDKSGHTDFDAIAKSLAKQQRAETIVLPGPAATAGEVIAKGEDASAEVVQFIRGWIERPKLTGRTAPEDRTAPGKIVAAQSMSSLGGGAGGLTATGNEAPPELEGLVIFVCADPKATKLPAGARRLTFRPSKSKDVCIDVTIDQWSGSAWAKVEAKTLYGQGAIVLGKDVNTWQIWVAPHQLGVKPSSEVAAVSLPLVKGKPKWPKDEGPSPFPDMKTAAPDNPSTWQKQRLW